ncbi:MAG TPA: sulfite oxidase [Gaiella sp.]|jgi:DMSO/TMAO reductase YedYZ molybdopterin-dependent catalytic subunit
MAPRGSIAGDAAEASVEGVSLAELQLAARNSGMPLEALRYPVTPVGLHYLLTHYDIPAVDRSSWRLRIAGAVRDELELSLDELRTRPHAIVRATMECAGNGRALLEPRPVSQPWLAEAVGTAEWGGTPLAPLLREAGLADDVAEILFTGLDRGVEGGETQSYERSLPLDEALREEVLLAYEVNGEPLPAQHGAPLRLVVPGWYGMTNVKWLGRVTALTAPFSGYQNAWSYRLRQDENEAGEPVSRMQPRALMVPPGIPEFLSRDRFVEPGPCRLVGRAWSGWGPIAEVDVSADGGGTWEAADLDDAHDPWAWRGWSYEWDASVPGRYELCCRARDTAGNEQPLVAPWNLGGYANNAVQRVAVNVASSL